jgi:pimeloyl-ACP methyl ester carboxylesterase
MRQRANHFSVYLAAMVVVAFTPVWSECWGKDEPAWPSEVNEIRYVSSADSSLQPALFYAPKPDEKTLPLLVALHTWSGSYKQKMSVPYANWCIKRGWVFIHPHFRGPNWTKQATGSELVVADIVGAVDYARAHANVDTNRVYLVGASGGGYTALLMAGRSPHIWAGVSAWVPISDLKAWYNQCEKAGRRYAEHIVKSCGGSPGTSAKVDLQYTKRSPITYLEKAKGLPLDINAGIKDGHTGSVPISHSLRAFNLVASEKDRISKENIKYFVQNAQVPPSLREELTDPTYGEKTPLFRRVSGNARITIFDGGHEIIYEAALSWLEKQKKQPCADTK